MNFEEVKNRAYAMPLTGPAFPPGPYRFTNREFLVVQYHLEDVTVKRAWTGPASLQRAHHAPATVAQLPLLEVLSGTHILTAMTLGMGTVLHGCLA